MKTSNRLLLKVLITIFVVRDVLSFQTQSRNSVKINSFKRYVVSSTSNPVEVIKPYSNIEISIAQNDTEVQVTKRYPIGSQPEFAIADDSTIETPIQRGLLWLHFTLLFYNLYLVSTSLTFGITSSFLIIKYISLVILSIVLGDFATGVFHWSVDNYGSIKTPIFGSVCAAFQGHHNTPWTITFRSFYNNLYKVAVGTIPALVLLSLSNCSTEIRVFFSLFINWWLLSQEFHKWSHMRNPPSYAKLLQDRGIILSRKEHGLHHQEPFNTNYCILTGVCNPILDKIHFYDRLENLIFVLTGNKPKNGNLNHAK